MIEEYLIPIVLFIILLPIIVDIINEYYSKKEEVNNNYPELIIGSCWKMKYKPDSVVKVKELIERDSKDPIVNILVEDKVIKLKLSTFLSEYKPYEY